MHGEEGAAAYDDGGVTVAEVASFHEFGLGVPQRSFIRGWYDENSRTTIPAVLRARWQAVARGADERSQLEIAGLQFEASIRERILRHIPPPLAPSTVARKGSSTPLVDTSQLINAIRAKVV